MKVFIMIEMCNDRIVVLYAMNSLSLFLLLIVFHMIISKR